MKKAAATLTALILSSTLAVAQPSAQPWPTTQWAESTPEAQGMDSATLARVIDFGAANGMDSLVVTRNGTLVTEAYFAPYQPQMLHRINSATKAVVGMLTGIAIAEGKLKGTAEPVVEFFPGRTFANLDDNKQAITVQHLLDQTSGIAWNEGLGGGVPVSLIELERQPDWVQFTLDRPMAQAPGQGFNYNSGNSHLLSAIITQQVGMGLPAYATQKIFAPLGITEFKWRTDPKGIATGGWGLYFNTRDMAKLGLLYARGGEWEGKQLVPREWVSRVFAPKVAMNLAPGVDFRYADQWWSLPARNVYMATGFNRQLIIVNPKTGVVVATTARQNHDMLQLMMLISQATKGEMQGAPLPDNPQGTALLREKIALAARGPEPVARVMSPTAQRVSGQTYVLKQNMIGVKSFSLDFAQAASGTASITVETYVGRTAETRSTTIPLGLDGRPAIVAPAKPGDGTMATGGRWDGDDTFIVNQRIVEEADVRRYVMRFSGNDVSIDFTNNVGMQASLTGSAR